MAEVGNLHGEGGEQAKQRLSIDIIIAVVRAISYDEEGEVDGICSLFSLRVLVYCLMMPLMWLLLVPVLAPRPLPAGVGL